MKRLLTLFAFLPLISAADFVPTFSNAWNIALSARESHRIDWYQASTVRRVYEFNFNNAPLSFPTNTVVTWDVVYATNQLLSLVATTGTIVNAESGQVRFDLTPEESNLTEGNYIGYVKAWDVSVSPAQLITPLVRQAITVLFSTDSRFYDFVGPLTYDPGFSDALRYVTTNDAARVLDFSGAASVRVPLTPVLPTDAASMDYVQSVTVPASPEASALPTVLIYAPTTTVSVVDGPAQTLTMLGPCVITFASGILGKMDSIALAVDKGTYPLTLHTNLTTRASYNAATTNQKFSIFAYSDPFTTNWVNKIWVPE